MLRTALRPRFLGLLLVALLCIAAFVQLGRWQLGVAQDKATQQVLDESATREVVPLDTLLQPHDPFVGTLSARPVSVTGQWSPTEQVLVIDRRLEGRAGSWVITAFRTDAGAVLPVLRGFVEGDRPAPTAPRGRLVIEGGLAPAESAVSAAGLPPGQLRSVDLSRLVNLWPGDSYDAFLFLQKESPAPGADPTDPATLNRTTTVPTPTKSAGLSWRNASYAAQWWVFAIFALWLWWRMVRDEHRRAQPNPTRAATDPVPTDPRRD